MRTIQSVLGTSALTITMHTRILILNIALLLSLPMVNAEDSSNKAQRTQVDNANTIINTANQTSDSTSHSLNVLIYYHSPSYRTQPMIELLEQKIKEAAPSFKVTPVNIINANEPALVQSLNQDTHCIMTKGVKASHRIANLKPSQPIFALDVPRTNLDKLYKVYKRLGVTITGIYQEQPIARQLWLAKAINPMTSSVAMLFNRSDRNQIKPIKKFLSQANVNLNYKILQSTDLADKFIPKVAENKSYFLLSNNAQFFPEANIKSVVLTANRYQVRLIGNKQNDTKLGALATVYTDSQDLVQQAAKEIISICEERTTTKPKYATAFSVDVNQHIAQAARLAGLSTKELSVKVKQLESQYLSKVSDE